MSEMTVKQMNALGCRAKKLHESDFITEGSIPDCLRCKIVLYALGAYIMMPQKKCPCEKTNCGNYSKNQKRGG